MLGNDEQRDVRSYSSILKTVGVDFFKKSDHRDADQSTFHSPEIETLEQCIRDYFERGEQLINAKSPSTLKRYRTLSLDSLCQEEFEREITLHPPIIQALAYFYIAKRSYGELCDSSTQPEPRQRHKTLLHIQEQALRALTLLETTQRRSEKARLAGTASHEQSAIIKARALKLLDELCPVNGWRSIHQAAQEIYRILLPDVEAMRGRLSPFNFEERLVRWLSDRKGALNQRYHELKIKPRA